MIRFETARDIAYAYREVETAEKLLAELAEAKSWHKPPDVRDAFGRRQDGLQLGIPSGDSSRRMYHVAWELAVPIVEAHMAASKANIAALTQKAKAEIWGEEVRARVDRHQLSAAAIGGLTFVDDGNVPGPYNAIWNIIQNDKVTGRASRDTARDVLIELGFTPVNAEPSNG